MAHPARLVTIPIGTTFGRLTVTSPPFRHGSQYHCYGVRCTCGRTRTVRASGLVTGHSTSCGCQQRSPSTGPKSRSGSRSGTIQVGQRYGRWLVLRDATEHAKERHVECRCGCGTVRRVKAQSLLNGLSKSCGCLNADLVSTLKKRHGDAAGDWRVRRTPEYRCWRHLKHRCENPADKSWNNYGGRGIRVCAEWNAFEAFLAHVGRRPSPAYSIDRINNDGHYEPGNVRWATRSQQAKNRRPAVYQRRHTAAAPIPNPLP